MIVEEITLFMFLAKRGRCDVIGGLLSEISARDSAHPAYLVTDESAGIKIDLIMCHNSCGSLPVQAPFSNGGISYEVLVHTILH